MSAPSYDAAYEAHLREVIREELEAEREVAREDRENWFWWIATLVVFGPFALAAVAGAFALDLGAKAIWAVRRRRAHDADDV